MKKIIASVLLIANMVCFYAAGKDYDFEDGYAVAEESGKYGVVNQDKKYCVEPIYETMQNLGEGYFFVTDKKYDKYIIDSTGKRLFDKRMKRAYHCSNGKIPVEGYDEDGAGDTRIFDVKTNKIGELIPNLWIYAGFFNDIGCFSTKNSQNKLKAVLVDTSLNRVIDMEFDDFEYRDFATGKWYMSLGGKKYVIDADGKLIQ